MKALVRDLKNDTWQVAEITRMRKCIFFPYGGDIKWWGEAIPYEKYKHLKGTMMSMNKRIFITEKDLKKNNKKQRKGLKCKCEYPIIRQDLKEYCSVCGLDIK